MTLPVVFSPHPLAHKLNRFHMLDGLRLAEIVERAAPGHDHADLVVRINDHDIPHGTWHLIKPKGGPDVIVTILRVGHGGGRRGGGGGGKNVLAIVATVALMAVATAATGGAFAMAGGLFAANSMSASLLAGAISVLGRMAITQLTSPAGADASTGEAEAQAAQLGNASAGGNQIATGGGLSRVVGFRRIYPKMVCEPLIDISGNSETIECVYALAGPHQISDLRIEGSPIGELPNINWDIVEGRSGQGSQAIVSRYGKTDPGQIELSGFKLRSTVSPWETVDTSATIADASPKQHIKTTASSFDEYWVHMFWPEGIGSTGATGARIQSVRMKIRPYGTETWTNMPELIFRQQRKAPLRQFIKFRYGTYSTTDAVQSNGAWAAFHTTAMHTQQAATGGMVWSAHSSFGSGVNQSLTSNVRREKDGFTIYLDRSQAAFATGQKWEIALKLSAATWGGGDGTTFPTTYAFPYNAGNTFAWDLFAPYNDGALKVWGHASQEQPVGKCLILRAVSVKNQTPTPIPGDAQIAVKGTDISVNQLSVLACGLVSDWNGTEWTGEVATDNPAAHLRHVYTGTISSRPVPVHLIDDGELVDWRARCIAAGVKVSAAFDGSSFGEVATAIASAGYASPRRSDVYGVFADYDTASEAPVQAFSPRNANNFVVEKLFPQRTDGFIVRFANEAINYEPDELMVVRPGDDATAYDNMPIVDAAGISSAGQITQRFQYDLAILDARDYTVTFETDVQSIACRMGDVIRVSHVILNSHAMQARLKSVEVNSSGMITAATVDDVVPVAGDPALLSITDIIVDENILDAGLTLAACVQKVDGTEVVQTITTSAEKPNVIRFATPIDPSGIKDASGDAYRLLVLIGPSTEVTGRYKVKKIDPTSRFGARITALPEAAETAVL